MTRIVSILLCALLVITPAAAEKKTQSEKIREKLVGLAPGSIVEVTQADGRWRGRLGELSAESFDVQVAGKEKVEKRSFLYTDVTKIRPISQAQGDHTARNIGVGMLAGVGVLALVGIIIGLAGGG